MGSFDDPPMGLVAGFLVDGLGILAAHANVRGEAKLLDEVADFVVVVALVEAEGSAARSALVSVA